MDARVLPRTEARPATPPRAYSFLPTNSRGGPSINSVAPLAFALAVLSIVVWGVTGPLFGCSDTWQLVINTGTTIVTFLMVFLIQNAQNRDTQALQMNFDELIRVNMAARNSLMGLEEKSELEVENIKSALVDVASSTEETAVESNSTRLWNEYIS